MNLPKQKLTKEEQKKVLEENKRLSELQHSLVIKILTWKTASTTNSDRITPKEWKAYQNHILTISKTDSVTVVKDKLLETYNSIKRNGGFK